MDHQANFSDMALDVKTAFIIEILRKTTYIVIISIIVD